MIKRTVFFTLALVLLAVFATAEMPAIDDVAYPSVTIRACGDLMMHQRQLDLAWVTGGEYDFHSQYEYVNESLAAADYTVANLETTVGLYPGQYYSGFPRFNAPESLLETISDAGVDFLTLANNHMLDRYYDGLVMTVDNVENYGFDHGGAYRSREEADTPVVVDVNGFKLGFLCYTEHTNGMEYYCDSAAAKYGISYIKNADFKADVDALRDAGAEFVIVLPHWGTEYQRRPDSYVRAWAQKMADAGADMILGSHPHMVQPLEWLTANVDGVEKQVLIAWSMGNFISNMKIQYSDSGIIVQFTLTRSEDGIHVCDVGYVPIYCWKSENNIQALCSALWLDEKPEGMGSGVHSRLKASYEELVSLIGTDFKVIEK